MANEFESLEDGTDELPPWRRTVPLVLAVLLALALGLIVYLADRAAEERDRAIALQRHSFEVMLLASNLEGGIASSEVLLARYSLSGENGLGVQYQEQWRTVQAQMAALERATRDSPMQRANVAALKTAIADRGKSLTDVALRARYKQGMKALGSLHIASSSPDVRAIRNALKATIAQERTELAQRSNLVNRSEKQVSQFNDSYALIGLALLAAALLALWFAYGAMRERRYARRLAAAEAERVDGLENAVRERTEQLQNANTQLRREMEERLQAEQNVRQLQKMEAIGQLTGGIAHDFNNMLAVVVSGIDLARGALRRDPAKARRHLDSAMEGATRAAALTARLLAYARPELPHASRVDPDGLVLGMRDLIDRATNEGIAVLFDLDASGWCIWVEQAQLENALINLAVNARDAMEGRGTLVLSTRRLTLGEGEVGQCKPGDYVSLAVSDTGCGMTPDVIERAFEPFFTTKPVGKGTGLGLSQIFSFVRQSGGEIEVDSTPGQGATLRLILPRHRADDDRQDAPSTRPEFSHPAEAPLGLTGGLAELGPVEHPDPDDDDYEEPAGEGHVVLVVEDDARVLRSTMAALKSLGHRGISCDHPRKAAGLLARNPDIALILSDVLMPDMTGPEMIAALGDAIRQRPVIFVTGFAGEGERAAQLAAVPILRKPFTLAQLGRTIDEALGERREVA